MKGKNFKIKNTIHATTNEPDDTYTLKDGVTAALGLSKLKFFVVK